MKRSPKLIVVALLSVGLAADYAHAGTCDGGGPDGICDPTAGEGAACTDCDLVPNCGNAVCECGAMDPGCAEHEKLERYWCPQDCTITCGDGFCEGTESAGTCPDDCPTASCGDGVCEFEAGETHHSCTLDCPLLPGSCAAPDGACDPTSGEYAANCPDCFDLGKCGNLLCNVNEDSTVCPMDCCDVVGDCDDGNPCTDQACISSTCEYTNNTDACDDGDDCTTSDTCSGGVCAGTFNTNCCVSPTDCNDGNDCTADSCVFNGCFHANVSAGTACGNPDDLECSGPDACDGSGVCDPVDDSDGTTCATGQCLAGECSPQRFRPTALDDSGYSSTVPTNGVCVDGPAVGLAVIGGNATDGGGDAHAVVWEITDEAIGLVPLPEDGESESFTGCVLGGLGGGFTAVGSAGTTPVYWERDAGTGVWSVNAAVLPPGYSGGVMFTGCVLGTLGGGIAGAGEGTTGGGALRALYWPDITGAAKTLPLPGGSSAASSANFIIHTSDGRAVIAGWYRHAVAGLRLAVLWEETAMQSGVFNVHALPLPEGGRASFTGCVLGGLGDVIYASGTVELTDGTERAAAWICDPGGGGFLCSAATVLPPLAGLENSREASIGTGINNQIIVYGSSYPLGGTPALNGTATRWTLDISDPNAAIKTITDVNDLATSLPAGCSFAGCVMGLLGDFQDPTSCPLPSRSLVGDMVCTGATAKAGPATQSAAVLEALPENIPATTTWGLIVMALLLCTAAGVLLSRRPMNRHRRLP